MLVQTHRADDERVTTFVSLMETREGDHITAVGVEAEALARGWTSEAWVVWWVASVAYMENPATVRTLRKRRPEV
jgi:hypothetical protein